MQWRSKTAEGGQAAQGQSVLTGALLAGGPHWPALLQSPAARRHSPSQCIRGSKKCKCCGILFESVKYAGHAGTPYLPKQLQGEGFCGDIVRVAFEQTPGHEPDCVQLCVLFLNALRTIHRPQPLKGHNTAPDVEAFCREYCKELSLLRPSAAPLSLPPGDCRQGIRPLAPHPITKGILHPSALCPGFDPIPARQKWTIEQVSVTKCTV